MAIYLTSDISRCLGVVLGSVDPPLLLPTVFSLPSLKTDHAERINPCCKINNRQIDYLTPLKGH